MPKLIRHLSSFISPNVWSARLNQNFVGCLGSMIVDGIPWDLELASKPCWANKLVRKNCSIDQFKFDCKTNYCKNNEICLPESNEFKCDCSHSNFISDICATSIKLICI